MAAVTGICSFASDVCKIFGFDPKVTKSITIKIVPDDIIIVEAETILLEEQADELIELMTGTNTYEFKAYAKNKK